MPRESRSVQRPCIEWLRGQGAYVYNTIGSTYTQRGTPDLLACWQGDLIGVECKLPGEDATDEQKREGAKIVEAGGRFYVVHSLEELKEWLI